MYFLLFKLKQKDGCGSQTQLRGAALTHAIVVQVRNRRDSY